MTNAYSVTRLYYYTPDGSSTELVDTGYYGQPTFTQCDPGYYCPTPPTNRGTTFISDDGSQIEFISDTAISDWINYGNPTLRDVSGYLMIFRDGTRYRVNSGVVSSIEDRNGNTITITSTAIVDSVGRTISFSPGNPGNSSYAQAITYPGAGGQTRTITIQYAPMSGALRNGFGIETNQQLFSNTGPDYVVTNINPSVITSITLPDGSSYQFLYNSYVELAAVVLPTGGRYEFDWDGLPGDPGGDDMGTFTVTRRVTEVREYPDGSTLAHKQVISYPPIYQAAASGTYTTTVSDYDYTTNSGGQLIQTVNHEFYYAWTSSSPLDHSPWISGREFLTQTYGPNGALLESKTLRGRRKGRCRGRTKATRFWMPRRRTCNNPMIRGSRR